MSKLPKMFRGSFRKINSATRKLIIGLLLIYSYFISPIIGQKCRFSLVVLNTQELPLSVTAFYGVYGLH